MRTRYLIFSLMLLLTLASRGQQSISPLSHEISLQTDSITKAQLLDTISQIIDVHFSYNPELLEAHNKVKLSIEKQSLLDIIQLIINPDVVGFHVLNNQVVFYPLKKEEEQVPVKVNPFITIRGKITDAKEKDPIPFCYIAIQGTGVGTITNNNGIFQIKIPAVYKNDTLRISCLGYKAVNLSIASVADSTIDLMLERSVLQLKTVEIFHYQPALLLQHFLDNLDKNYDDQYTLLTTFYREIILENSNYTDVSEAVLHVLKAPYSNEYREDLVKFIKGRKSSDVRPFEDIKFRLKGGPYYITKLDVVKNRESFINPDFINLFLYEFEEKTLLSGRETAVVSFTPVFNLRDMLYEGLIYFDIETGAVARVEFNYTKQGIKEARRLMIEKEPRDCRAVPVDLSYTVDYTYIDGKWYLFSAHSAIQIKIYDKEKKQKTKFKSTSEILVTNIEKGDLQHFSRKDIFRPNEFFTEKITNYDEAFWESYNVIEPEEAMGNAIKDFDEHNLIISNK